MAAIIGQFMLFVMTLLILICSDGDPFEFGQMPKIWTWYSLLLTIFFFAIDCSCSKYLEDQDEECVDEYPNKLIGAIPNLITVVFGGSVIILGRLRVIN